MPVVFEDVLAQMAKPRAKRGELVRVELLVAEHQHRMVAEDVLDLGENRVVETREVDARDFGAEPSCPAGGSTGQRSFAFERTWAPP